MIVVVPSDIALTLPFASTVAISLFSDFHLIDESVALSGMGEALMNMFSPIDRERLS